MKKLKVRGKKFKVQSSKFKGRAKGQNVLGGWRAQFTFLHVSLAPGFSRVLRRAKCGSRFNGFGGWSHYDGRGEKPLKRLARFTFPNTRLKPGANEMAARLQETERHPWLAGIQFCTFHLGPSLEL